MIIASVIAMLVFAAATQGWFLTKSRWWETGALLLIAFLLFRPGFVWDKFYPPLTEKPATELEKVVAEMTPGTQLRLQLKGEKDNGDEFQMTVMLPIGDEATGGERLSSIGLETRDEDGKVIVDLVGFGSPTEKAGIDFDQEIIGLQMETDRPPKQLVFFPALLLLALVWFIQRGRARKHAEVAAA